MREIVAGDCGERYSEEYVVFVGLGHVVFFRSDNVDPVTSAIIIRPHLLQRVF